MSESVDGDAPIQINDGPTSASEVQWGALWEEFGFDTPDAVGAVYASETQLKAAIQASEQGIQGDAETLINDAVSNDELRVLEVPACTRGYVWRGDAE